MKKSFYSVVLAASVFSVAYAQTDMAHEPSEFFSAGKRISLQAVIKDDKGVESVKTFFKPANKYGYTYVDMTCKGEVCTSVLPVAADTTEAIDYVFVAKNSQGVLTKSQIFQTKKKEDDNKNDDKNVDTSDIKDAIDVISELKDQGKELSGFKDNINIKAASSSEKLGSAVELNSVAETGVGATEAASAAGVTSTTTTVAVATAAGVSTTAMVVGGLAVVGGGAAAAGGGGGGGDSDTHSSSGTQITSTTSSSSLIGNYRVTSPENSAWYADISLQDSNHAVFTECYSSYGCSDGTAHWSFENLTYTFDVDGSDSHFSGQVSGSTSQFTVNGVWGDGTTSATNVYTRK